MPGLPKTFARQQFAPRPSKTRTNSSSVIVTRTKRQRVKKVLFSVIVLGVVWVFYRRVKNWRPEMGRKGGEEVEGR